MTKIKDLFGDLALDKPIEVEIEGKTLELDMRAADLHPLMTLGEGEIDEDKAKKLTDVLRRILCRSYLPHYDDAEDEASSDLSKSAKEENEEVKDYIEGLIVRYYLKLFTEISKALNWQDEEEIDNTLRRAEKKGSRQQ